MCDTHALHLIELGLHPTPSTQHEVRVLGYLQFGEGADRAEMVAESVKLSEAVWRAVFAHFQQGVLTPCEDLQTLLVQIDSERTEYLPAV
jgi:hypothetical protein